MRDVMTKQQAKEKALATLELTLAAMDEKLGKDKSWIRFKRLVRRLMKVMDYPWTYLPLLRYSDYLKTEHWEEIRRKALGRANGRCQVCNADGELHTHHRTYENLGSERDNDVVALCKECHALFHERRELAELDTE